MPRSNQPGLDYCDLALFSGRTSDIVADLEALRALGVSAVDIDFERPDPESLMAKMRRFREEVLSRL